MPQHPRPSLPFPGGQSDSAVESKTLAGPVPEPTLSQWHQPSTYSCSGHRTSMEPRRPSCLSPFRSWLRCCCLGEPALRGGTLHRQLAACIPRAGGQKLGSSSGSTSHSQSQRPPARALWLSELLQENCQPRSSVCVCKHARVHMDMCVYMCVYSYAHAHVCVHVQAGLWQPRIPVKTTGH